MSTPNSCNDGVCEMNDMLQKMSTDDNDTDVSVCANCGKEGANNVCNKCKQVKYCNAACKKKHRHKHKKLCEEYIRRSAEKHNEELKLTAEHEAKLYDDEKLFKQPPPDEDCPICFLRLPHLKTGSIYMSCCGKVICGGCEYAVAKKHNTLCPFCRTPRHYSTGEAVEREKIRMEADDAYAIYNIGCDYQDGAHGFPQDYTRALELFHRAGELGNTWAYLGIANAYFKGRGVDVDEKKATYYYELSAMGGDAGARHNLGNDEWRAGNMERALKHHMIAVKGGSSQSLYVIKKFYSKGHASKDDYTTALRSYQEYLLEVKSEQRDVAAAADEKYRYY